jgi:hypothetical protein
LVWSKEKKIGGGYPGPLLYSRLRQPFKTGGKLLTTQAVTPVAGRLLTGEIFLVVFESKVIMRLALCHGVIPSIMIPS